MLGDLKKLTKDFRLEQTEIIKIADIEVELGILSLQDEITAQTWATERIGDSNNAISFSTYYQLAAIALSIRRIADFDFSMYGPDDEIETGEVTGDGITIKKSRFKILLDLVRGWDSVVVEKIFEKFFNLQSTSRSEFDRVLEHQELEEPPEVKSVELKEVGSSDLGDFTVDSRSTVYGENYKPVQNVEEEEVRDNNDIQDKTALSG